MMNKKFANPYIIYYPVISRDGMPFPVNRIVRDIQKEVNKGRRQREDQLWRGNLVAVKFADDRFTQMMDASMADFPILKNFLRTHPFPGSAGTLPTHPTTTAASPTTTHPTHPSPPLPSLNHPAMTRQMQFAEPTASGAAIPHSHSHGIPMAMMPTPRRDPKPISAEHHQHHHQHHQHQHQHQLPQMEL
jgi:hypothetical protein